jgi:lipoprotein-anchoring transpeptidase ErfK/SrfK
MRKLLISVVALAMLSSAPAANALEPAGPTAPAPAETAAAPAPAPLATPAATANTAPAKPVPPAITLTANINLTTQRMTVSYGGKAQHTWAISSGVREHASPVGSFKPQWQSKMWFSRKYDMAPMPHAVFFSGGVAVHATQATGRLGSPASHGCIRLAPANAAQFYALVTRHGNAHTRIIVNGTPRYNDEMASRRSRSNQVTQVPAPRAERRGYVAYTGPAYYAPQQPARVIYRSASYSQPVSTTRIYRY